MPNPFLQPSRFRGGMLTPSNLNVPDPGPPPGINVPIAPGIKPLPIPPGNPTLDSSTVSGRPGAADQFELPQSYAAEDGTTSSGMARYGGPQLNTEGALAGLKAMQPSQSPLLQLQGVQSQNRMQAQQFGQGAMRADTANNADIDSFIGARLRPQAEQIQATQTAMSQHHPAVQGLLEKEAIRRTYPAQAQAAGMSEAAEIAGDARVAGDTVTAMAKQRSDSALPLEELLKQRTALLNFEGAESDPQVQNYLNALNQLIGLSLSQRGIDPRAFIQ